MSSFASIVESHYTEPGSKKWFSRQPLWESCAYVHYGKKEVRKSSPPLDRVYSINRKSIHIVQSTSYIIERLLDDTVRRSFPRVKLQPPSSESINAIRKAFRIIKNHYPLYEINECLDAIAFISGKNIIAFTSIEAPGIVFFRPRNKKENEFFYCEHIVHEVSHIALNYLLANPSEYFTADAFELRYNSPFRKDKRGLYHVVHAVYVLSKITLFFDQLSGSKYMNNPKHRFEILGRLALASYRLENSIGEISGEYYTRNGMRLLNYLKNVSRKYGYSNNEKVKMFDLKNQSIEYNHYKFMAINKESLS